MIEKKLGVVICNFNKKEYLKQCLSSVLESDLSDKDYEIVVVDNASTDGAPQMVKEEFSNVILLENIENTGGSGGFARGMQYAIDKGYEYVALLDNDIKLDENTLSTMLEYLAQNPNVGVVGAKICQMDHPDLLQEFGSFIDQEKFEISTPLKGQKDGKDLPEFVNCDYVPACCLIVRKKVLKEAGVFDASYFIYWDDMDWCTRVRNLGYEIHAIKNARVLHKMGAKDSSTTFSNYYFHRNRLRYFLSYLTAEKLDEFLLSIEGWLINSTFFAWQKGLPEVGMSSLICIDDLFLHKLGKQPNSILSICTPKKLLPNYSKAHLFIRDHIQVHQEIRNFLEKKYKNLSVIDSFESVESGIPTFFAVEHILKAKSLQPKYSGLIVYIDKYLNFTFDLEEIKQSHENYSSLFSNIHMPIIKEKLLSIK